VSQVNTNDASDSTSIADLQSQVSNLQQQIQSIQRNNGDDVSALSGSLVGGRTAAGQHRNVKKVRVINSVQHTNDPVVQHSIPNTISANETDTNADTCCLGNNYAVLRFTNRSATVAPYHDNYKVIDNVSILTGATVYDNPDTGESVLLIVHEQLYEDVPIARKISSLTMLDVPDAPPPLGLDHKANKYSNTRAEVLAGRWGIGRKWAEATLKKTSQTYFRSAVSPLDRRYRADCHLQVKRLDTTMSTGTAFFTHKSLDGNKAAQIYGTTFLYNKSYPMPDSV
jgi:hypothetical protein